MSNQVGLLDTNVLIRHFRQDHVDHSPRATALVSAIEQGTRVVRLVDTVVFETVFTLQSHYRVPRVVIKDGMLPILDLPGVVLPGKRVFHEIFELYVAQAGLSFADCYHLTFAKQLTSGTIISFDRKQGRIPGINRIEP